MIVHLQRVQTLPAVVMAMLLLLCNITQAQPQQHQTSVTLLADDARIARLVGLARVWGAVKYFHPYLAYREIDWDQALVETIPQVNAAKTPQEYSAAINHLLSFLNDKNTRAKIRTETKPPANTVIRDAAKESVRVRDGVLIVDVAQIAQTEAPSDDAFKLRR